MIPISGITSDWDVIGIGSYVASTIMAIIALVASIASFPSNQIFDCVKIKLAPKVYLVEKASELYKENKKQ